MRDNTQITEKVVFQKKVETIEMTDEDKKLIVLYTDDNEVLVPCIAFKNQAAKDKHITSVSKFNADKVAIDLDIKKYDKKKDVWIKNKTSGYIRGDKMTDTAFQAAKNSFYLSIEKERSTLLSEKNEIASKIKALKIPSLDISEAMQGNFKVTIADTSVFDGLVSQITI